MSAIKEAENGAAPQQLAFAAVPEEAAPNPENTFQRPTGTKLKRMLILVAVFGLGTFAAGLIWRHTLRTNAPVFQLARVEKGSD